MDDRIVSSVSFVNNTQQDACPDQGHETERVQSGSSLYEENTWPFVGETPLGAHSTSAPIADTLCCYANGEPDSTNPEEEVIQEWMFFKHAGWHLK
jgi:hypothetical protein